MNHAFILLYNNECISLLCTIYYVPCLGVTAYHRKTPSPSQFSSLHLLLILPSSLLCSPMPSAPGSDSCLAKNLILFIPSFSFGAYTLPPCPTSSLLRALVASFSSMSAAGHSCIATVAAVMPVYTFNYVDIGVAFTVTIISRLSSSSLACA